MSQSTSATADTRADPIGVLPSHSYTPLTNAAQEFDWHGSNQRRNKEPQFRRFPSLWQTFTAERSTFLTNLEKGRWTDPTLSARNDASPTLCQFFAKLGPHRLYPYVWVRSAVSTFPDRQGLHSWLMEVMVSYEEGDMPQTAPVRFSAGRLLVPSGPTLQYGKTPRFTLMGTDLVMTRGAYLA